jgi:hypothetical protein
MTCYPDPLGCNDGEFAIFWSWILGSWNKMSSKGKKFKCEVVNDLELIFYDTNILTLSRGYNDDEFANSGHGLLEVGTKRPTRGSNFWASK